MASTSVHGVTGAITHTIYLDGAGTYVITLYFFSEDWADVDGEMRLVETKSELSLFAKDEASAHSIVDTLKSVKIPKVLTGVGV